MEICGGHICNSGIASYRYATYHLNRLGKLAFNRQAILKSISQLIKLSIPKGNMIRNASPKVKLTTEETELLQQLLESEQN